MNFELPTDENFPRKSKNDSQYYSIKLISFFTWNKNWIFFFRICLEELCLKKRSVLFLHGNEIKLQFIHRHICTTSKKKIQCKQSKGVLIWAIPLFVSTPITKFCKNLKKSLSEIHKKMVWIRNFMQGFFCKPFFNVEII